MFGHYGAGHVTLYFKKKKRDGKDESESTLPEGTLDDGVDSAADFSVKLLSSLKVRRKEDKVLLACAWTDNENRRKFEMFWAPLLWDD